MYNPLMKDIFVVRFKMFYTTMDGVVGVQIQYSCIDKLGIESKAEDMFGTNIYAVLRDYTSINLSNPLIQVI
jgi:hypothetical protein